MTPQQRIDQTCEALDLPKSEVGTMIFENGICLIEEHYDTQDEIDKAIGDDGFWEWYKAQWARCDRAMFATFPVDFMAAHLTFGERWSVYEMSHYNFLITSYTDSKGRTQQLYPPSMAGKRSLNTL
jgi:hypothetical protein